MSRTARRIAGALLSTSLLSCPAIAQQLPHPVSAALTGREKFLAVIIAAMMLCGIVSFAIRGRVSERPHVAMSLFIVLIGGFGLLVLFGGMLYEEPWAAALILLLLVGMFKLMSAFEAGRKTDKESKR
jgi:hypothetical protein